jgi:PP-loop superfamily ATP-utilizing enzyme
VVRSKAEVGSSKKSLGFKTKALPKQPVVVAHQKVHVDSDVESLQRIQL